MPDELVAAEFRVEDHPDPLDIEVLETQIRREASAAMGLGEEADLAIFVRDAGRVVAGISGWTWGDCCELQSLWVEPSLRGRGLATGLIAAGYAGTPQLGLTRELFHRCQQRNGFTVLGCPAGGWSYSGPDGWPVTLESAEILSALARLPGHETDPVLRTGIAWLIGRQDRRGSWSLWVRDTKLPNDGPCPGITAQGIVALLDAGHSPGSRPVTAAVRWLLSEARPDGTFENLWYRDFTSGTAMALDALCQAGQAEQPACHGARDWLIAAQRADGSWGDGTASCPGSVEETAWALPALLAAGVPPSSAAVQRGIEWLLQAQQPDGSWQPSRVCAYIRHVMHYPNGAITRGHALRALAAYRDAMRSDGTAAGAR